MNIRDLKVGQCIVSASGNKGFIVGIIDKNEYNEQISKNDWNYLKTGVLIDFEDFGIIHYKDQDQFNFDFE